LVQAASTTLGLRLNSAATSATAGSWSMVSFFTQQLRRHLFVQTLLGRVSFSALKA
jgi:hypothetical protein